MSSEPLLKVRDLQTHFFTEEGVVRAVDGISFDIYEREMVGIVGESGAGKSVAAQSIMRLVESPGESGILVLEVVAKQHEPQHGDECDDSRAVRSDPFDAQLPGRPRHPEQFQHENGYTGDGQKEPGIL